MGYIYSKLKCITNIKDMNEILTIYAILVYLYTVTY